MQLIIESGSTKADWLFFSSNGEKIKFTTHGLNPTTMRHLNVIELDDDLTDRLHGIDIIHFYGAGVNSEETISRIKKWLRLKSPKAEIFVTEDTLAAARACFGNKEGFVGILGTGSNSCYYDGQSVKNLTPTLGFIISDEGGGVYLGKEVLRSYFYKTMPSEECKFFEEHYLSDKPKILKKLYIDEEANRFLASYASFLTDINTEWTRTLVRTCLQKYLDVRISPYYDEKNLPLSFVGSIAYYHFDILSDLCKKNHIYLKEVIHKPLDRLLEYHLSLLV